MKTFIKTGAACALLLGFWQAATGVQPTETSAASPTSVGETGWIERGGKVDAVDLAKQLVVVEGVSYRIPSGSVRIHSDGSVRKMSDVKAGMQIRFVSTQPDRSGASQLREIWVTAPAPAAAARPRR